MIHLKVKQIRYKYRYGCNMKKPQKNQKPKPKTQPGGVGTMRVNSADKTILVADIFQSIFIISKYHG